MMKSLVVFISLLLVVQFVENISGEIIKHARPGDDVALSGPKSLKQLVQCSVEHNGIDYELYPHLNIVQVAISTYYAFCDITVSLISLDRAGKWKLRTIWNNSRNHIHQLPATTSNLESVYTNFTIYVEEADNELLSRDYIHGENVSYANIYFKDYADDVTKCYIVKVGYHNEPIYILGDNGNGTSAGLKLYEKCGVRIPINDEWSGDWKLVQELGDYILQTGNFTIVSNSKMSPFTDSHEIWLRGSTHTGIDIKKYGANSYCEVEAPYGKVIPLIDSNCEYSVEKVHDGHAGIWKARYFSESSMYNIERRIVVHVLDPEVINATVTTTKDNIIHILCQTFINKVDFCFFTNPNGTMIKASPGFGDEKYVYHGTDHYSMCGIDFAQCGITILQPSSDDYGLWKCTIINQNSRGIMRGSVSVAHLNNDS